MVLGSHVIFAAYGFWLPNDPRGSWSEFVGSWDLFRLGRATRPAEVRSVAHDRHDYRRRISAKESLNRPAVSLSDRQITSVAAGFGRYACEAKLTVWACSILAEHVHLVVARHRLSVEQIVIGLKGHATESLLADRVHPFQAEWTRREPPPKCWARGEWKAFLDTGEDIFRAIAYVEENPGKEGRPPQRWPFVTPFHPAELNPSD